MLRATANQNHCQELQFAYRGSHLLGEILRGELKKVKNGCPGVWSQEVLLEEERGLLRPQREQESERPTDLGC